ncbi:MULTISPECIES: DUF1499 domain-containing protein [Pontibacillus]|uniref:DUF1499 domain-containing protein n=1 Tax=Pontibacillus chungwhensis TaxID=265426 RepID=A0ABY8UYR2_9BACI|nr:MULTISPECIES: DUF1499 domain-containing protein [Pontibacillus]MCD5324847.1 DUF1499 domain-containing protein [Pontibacillus sp. HN14]WIF98805.1 DUF1499 domain-containing protein [Pontibacillus chungwhensis]
MSQSNLGVKDGKLAECPSSPNCVSTQAEDASKKMEPLPFKGTREETKDTLKNILNEYGRVSIEEETEDYIHATFKTKIMRFTDDVEFYLDDNAEVVHFRSASRVGYSDLGKNRSRMEEIRTLYNK